YWTIKKAAENIPNAEIFVAFPEHDKEGSDDFENVISPYIAGCYYGHSSSPLARILHLTESLSNDEYIVRIDGVHMLFDTELTLNMLNQASSRKLDCVKLPDDFPIQFTSDIYRVGALRKLNNILNKANAAEYYVHPKFYLFAHPEEFNCEYANPPHYEKSFLLECRNLCKTIYDEPRLDVQESKIIWSGDQMAFHYEIAKKYLMPHMSVLDIGCGEGFGCRLLAPAVRTICGLDADVETVERAKLIATAANVSFCCEDATNTSYADATFDVVTCMELLEHIPPHSLLQEIKRVLKTEGFAVFSTPQNCMGDIPVNFQHLKEFSPEEVTGLCQEFFSVVAVIGIKQGRIVISDDPRGTNTVVICRNA
ncbi:MAG: methyltransferase domain-containing protein, partial [Desulfuromonadales bacterium]